MGSVTELKDAVKDALQRKGLLPQLQASVRSHIFGVLLAAEDAPRPEPCDETLVINELIREYLVFNGLRDTVSVFLPESGQPSVRPFDREFLAKKLRIQDTPQTQQVPLLYALVARQQQPSAGLSIQQQQQSSAIGGASSSKPQLQQRRRLVAGDSTAGRLLLPTEQQQLALKDVDGQFSELHSLSSVSQTTQGS